MKNMKIMKNEKWHCQFTFMPFMFFMVQKNDDIMTSFEPYDACGCTYY